MPKFADMNTIKVAGGGNFQFSAIRPDKLGATEYTLVTIVVDTSSSVDAFKDELLSCIKAVVAGCQRNPRADNLMVRLMTFNSHRQEIHGFVPLRQLQADQYAPLKCQGMTALYDATYDALTATVTYAEQLSQYNLAVNAAIYILTDGEDNESKIAPSLIAKEMQRITHQESLESLVSVLVGVNTSQASVTGYLQMFKDEAKLSQYVDIADATPATLAKLAAFVDKSIRAQSIALGTGTAGYLGF